MHNRGQLTNKKGLPRDSLQNLGKRIVEPEVSKIKLEIMDINKISMLTAAMRTMNYKLNL